MFAKVFVVFLSFSLFKENHAGQFDQFASLLTVAQLSQIKNIDLDASNIKTNIEKNVAISDVANNAEILNIDKTSYCSALGDATGKSYNDMLTKILEQTATQGTAKTNCDNKANQDFLSLLNVSILPSLLNPQNIVTQYVTCMAPIITQLTLIDQVTTVFSTAVTGTALVFNVCA